MKRMYFSIDCLEEIGDLFNYLRGVLAESGKKEFDCVLTVQEVPKAEEGKTLQKKSQKAKRQITKVGDNFHRRSVD